VDVNSYAGVYGYSREEFKGDELQDITLPERARRPTKDAEKLHQQGKVFVSERRHRRKNGEIATVAEGPLASFALAKSCTLAELLTSP